MSYKKAFQPFCSQSYLFLRWRPYTPDHYVLKIVLVEMAVLVICFYVGVLTTPDYYVLKKKKKLTYFLFTPMAKSLRMQRVHSRTVVVGIERRLG